MSKIRVESSVRARSLSDIAIVTRLTRGRQMRGRSPEKLEAYSLEYGEDFSGLRTK